MAIRNIFLSAQLVGVQSRTSMNMNIMDMNFTVCPKEEAKCYMSNADAGATIQGERPSFLQVDLLRTSALLTLSDTRGDCQNLGSPPVLAKKYNEIFAPSRNRNAASHLWAHYILSRAASCYSHSEIADLFSQFCPISGSPLGQDGGMTFQYDLPLIGGGMATGIAHHCCWPCACDTTDLLRVDTKTIKDKTGSPKEYNFFVIGDPCVNNPPVCQNKGQDDCIPAEAPAVVCETVADNAGSKTHRLKDAERSDNNHVIIGMMFNSEGAEPDAVYDTTKVDSDDGSQKTLKAICKERAEKGYDSGMGAIFQDVGRLNPLP